MAVTLLVVNGTIFLDLPVFTVDLEYYPIFFPFVRLAASYTKSWLRIKALRPTFGPYTNSKKSAC